MKIGMTLLVRNELDIIKHHIDYHRPKVDMMVVTDNGSVDGTFEYLKSLETLDFIVLEERTHNYKQSEWVTDMAHFLRKRGCGWVVESDVDEFWRGDLRKDVASAHIKGLNCVHVDSYSFLATTHDDLGVTDPRLRQKWRYPVFDRWPKVMHSTKDFKGVHDGNDDAYFTTTKKAITSKDCVIYHYSSRGLEHYKKKYLEGGEAIERSMAEGKFWNSRWTEPYTVYKEQGMEAFIQHWRDIRLFNDEKLKIGGIVEDSSFIEETLEIKNNK